MKRREEIENAANEFYKGDEVSTFVVAAQWADKTMIEKAHNWIKANMSNYINFEEGFIYEVDMADDLRKYLEE